MEYIYLLTMLIIAGLAFIIWLFTPKGQRWLHEK